MTSTPAGSSFCASHCVIRGSSRWQCGHQWAKKPITLAVPSPGRTLTSTPSNVVAANAGAAAPTAGSPSGCSKTGNDAPAKVTSETCSTELRSALSSASWLARNPTPTATATNPTTPAMSHLSSGLEPSSE